MKLKELKLKEYRISLKKPLVMGILNVTPDSFSDGGKFLEPQKAIAHAKQMVREGADIIDIGAESTRPGSQRISAREELERLLPIVEALREEIQAPLSIDTHKAEVAEEGLKRGAHMINDTYGLRDKKLRIVIAKYKAPAVVMHMQGTPDTMQINPSYDNVVGEVMDYVTRQASIARKEGIEQVIIDPGIGFGKTLEHNLLLLRHLEEFTTLGYPLMVGVSRKSFLEKILHLPVYKRLEGTLAAVAIATMKGAHMLRVHDVKECKRAIEVAFQIKNARF